MIVINEMGAMMSAAALCALAYYGAHRGVLGFTAVAASVIALALNLAFVIYHFS